MPWAVVTVLPWRAPSSNSKSDRRFFFLCTGKEFFDQSEIALLEEATGDVAFALEVFEKESMRKNAEQAVMESERRYQTLAGIVSRDLSH